MSAAVRIGRAGLVNRIRASRDTPVVAICAPPGYGKTMLLAEWAEREARRFTRLPLGPPDNRPGRLAARLREQGGAWTEPLVLALDGAHELTAREAIRLVAGLARDVPWGSQLVLSGRSLPTVGVSRLRVEGRLIEIGPAELRLRDSEAAALARSLGLHTPGEAAVLNDRAEGWPAGVALAARRGRGADRAVGRYLSLTLLARLERRELDFLLRGSLLEQLSVPLCNAAFAGEDAHERLDALARAGAFLFPLDSTGAWFRLHPLLRDELERRRARALPADEQTAIHRAAGEWLAAHGEVAAAVRQLEAAGDRDRLVQLVSACGQPLWQGRESVAVGQWLARLGDEATADHHPAVAVYAALAAALLGRGDVDRLAAAAEASSYAGPMFDGSASAAGWKACLRAFLARSGARPMRTDAEAAVESLHPDSPLGPAARLALGVGRALTGDPEGAEAALVEAADTALGRGLPALACMALAERALLAAGGESDAFDELVARAEEVGDAAQLEGCAETALAGALAARSAIRHGEWARARARLEAVERLRTRLGFGLPWYASQVRLELAHVHLSLGDTAVAAALADEIAALLRRRPGFRSLGAELAALRRELAVRLGGGTPPTSLTAAELRLIPLLRTHLSFREIADQLVVSRNTVKTQAISVYRKLGVSSRREAIERAGELELAVAEPARRQTRGGPPFIRLG